MRSLLLHKKRNLAGAVVLWALLAAAGGAAATKYEWTPGPQQSAPAVWPAQSKLTTAPGSATLVVFLHPRCFCSQATLTELEKLVAQQKKPVRVLAVFEIPAAADNNWRDSDTVRQARAIAGVTTIFDPGGQEARRFGAVTSGFVAAYNAAAHLRFAGGITSARGRTGEGVSWMALARALDNPSASPSLWRVFGCGLVG